MCSHIDMAVWLVNRHDPERRVYFPAEENSWRWLNNYEPDNWRIVPISDEENERLRKAARLD